MKFEMDMGLVFESAWWTIKTVIIGMPWWVWLLLIASGVVNSFARNRRRRY